MPSERDPLSFHGGPLLAAGVGSDSGWVFSGVVPDGVVRLEARTSVGATYPVACHSGRWEVRLPVDDPSETVCVRAFASTGETVATELCRLRAPDPSGSRRQISRWLKRHLGRARRGGVTYGPG